VAAYPIHGKTVADLMRAADAAMYAAKREGRDRVEFAQAEIRSPLPKP
jgi:GGDEF domain-containing protein